MKVILLMFISSTAMAAGDGHGGPADLIAPAVNLSLLFGFLIWKLKGPMSDFFKGKSTETKEMIERAATKAKEAQMMMETQKRKIEGADAEISKMENEANAVLEKFEQDYKISVDRRINKLKEDAGQKIEAEKKELLDKLNSQLLDEVIKNTKTKLQSDKSLGDEATKQILQGLN